MSPNQQTIEAASSDGPSRETINKNIAVLMKDAKKNNPGLEWNDQETDGIIAKVSKILLSKSRSRQDRLEIMRNQIALSAVKKGKYVQPARDTTVSSFSLIHKYSFYKQPALTFIDNWLTHRTLFYFF